MPLPLVQIGVFAGVFVPWIVLLKVIGIPFESPWHVLYIVPPGVLTWLATRPVIEGKRLTELLLSQSRYFAEPRTWCRLTPIREPREVVIVARVWRRPGATVPVASSEYAALKSSRSRENTEAVPVPVPEPVPAQEPVPATLVPSPALVSAPQSLAEYAAQRDPQPTPAMPTSAQVASPAVPAARSAPLDIRAADADAHVAGPDLRVAGPDIRVAGPEPQVTSPERHVPSFEHRATGPEHRVPVRQPKAWRRTTRDISHEDDVLVVHQDLERPPATPHLEAPGAGKRALASGVRRPGAPPEFWKAITSPPNRPAILQQPPAAPGQLGGESPREASVQQATPLSGPAPASASAGPRRETPQPPAVPAVAEAAGRDEPPATVP